MRDAKRKVFSQAYFWSKSWQKQIKKSEEEIKKGKYKVYWSAEDLKRDIEKWTATAT